MPHLLRLALWGARSYGACWHFLIRSLDDWVVEILFIDSWNLPCRACVSLPAGPPPTPPSLGRGSSCLPPSGRACTCGSVLCHCSRPLPFAIAFAVAWRQRGAAVAASCLRPHCGGTPSLKSPSLAHGIFDSTAAAMCSYLGECSLGLEWPISLRRPHSRALAGTSKVVLAGAFNRRPALLPTARSVGEGSPARPARLHGHAPPSWGPQRVVVGRGAGGGA